MKGRQAVPEDFFKNLSPAQHQKVADYLGKFIVPEDTELGQKCIACDSYFTGTLGLSNHDGTHGEGTCYECGWPWRGVHDIPDIGRIEVVPLMYARRDRS
jgi:hypothetical protein